VEEVGANPGLCFFPATDVIGRQVWQRRRDIDDVTVSNSDAARRLLVSQRGQPSAIRTGDLRVIALVPDRQDGAADELEDEVVANDGDDEEGDERRDAVKFARDVQNSRSVSAEASLRHDGQRVAVVDVERGDEPDDAVVI